MTEIDRSVQLDDNGDVRNEVPAVNNVETGDTVVYTLQPNRSAQWKFVGYQTNQSPEAIADHQINPDNTVLTLTIGTGTSGEEMDLTLIFALDISGKTVVNPGVGSGAGDAAYIVKSNDPVIKFK